MTAAEFDQFIHSHSKKKVPQESSSRAKDLLPELADEITRSYKKELGLD
jgi:hypothetical protein